MSLQKLALLWTCEGKERHTKTENKIKRKSAKRKKVKVPRKFE